MTRPKKIQVFPITLLPKEGYMALQNRVGRETFFFQFHFFQKKPAKIALKGLFSQNHRLQMIFFIIIKKFCGNCHKKLCLRGSNRIGRVI